MAEGYLSAGMTHIETLIGKGKAQISMAEVPIEQAAPYAAADAEVAFRLRPILAKRMAEANATRVFEEIEMPLVPVLTHMEQAGVALDVPFLQGMSAELSQRMIEIEKEVMQAVGYSFNLNSTQQLSKVLFETLRLEPPDRGKKTASGHYSTSADVLEELSGQHPVVDLILEYRELSKLKSTYTDSLPLEINPRTGTRAYLVQPDRLDHRSNCILRAEPAKYSHPHRAWAAGAPGFCGRPWQGAALGRLFPDRAAYCGPHGRG